MPVASPRMAECHGLRWKLGVFAAVITLTLLAWPGCTFESVPLDGQCAADEKYCEAERFSPNHCVRRADPSYGCGSDLCVSCSGGEHAKLMGCNNRQECFIISCLPGWKMCGASAQCDTDLTNDVDNCGDCGNSCRLPGAAAPGAIDAHATSRCVNSQCVLDACQPRFADCNREFLDGCEAQLGTDAHCTGLDGCAPCARGQTCVPATGVGGAGGSGGFACQ